MAYEDILNKAARARKTALASGCDEAEAYRIGFATAQKVIRDRQAEQDRLWAEARAARLAADRLLYEGGRSPDDPEYLEAKAVADEAGRRFAEF